MQSNDNTYLMIAIKNNNTELAKALIDDGADINIQDNYGNNAFLEYAFDGHTETAKLLIDNGADINIQDINGLTALIEAANYRYTETVATLLEQGADLPDDKSKIISTMKKESWWTQMHAAIINNMLDQIQIFEYRESDITPLDLAIMTGNLDAVRALIGLGIQYDINACLKTAVIAKRNELARFCLENGANPSSNNKLGQNTFHIAASTNNHTIIRTLNEFYRKNNAAKLIQNNFRLSLFHSKERNFLLDEIAQNNKCIRIS